MPETLEGTGVAGRPVVGPAAPEATERSGPVNVAPPQAAKSAPAALSISEAARACGVHRRTIRHHRQAGDFPGAFRDEGGVWRIPLEDLEWVGLHAELDRVSEEPPPGSRVDLLRTEVAVLRERLRAAELIAMEREKRIDDLRLILRLLPSASLPAPSLPSATPKLGAGVGGGQEGVSPEDASRETSPSRLEGGESDPVIWLPDAPEDRGVPLESPARGDEEDEEPIWAPGRFSMSRDEAPQPPETEIESDTPRWVGAPLDIPPRRRRWLPWLRSRG